MCLGFLEGFRGVWDGGSPRGALSEGLGWGFRGLPWGIPRVFVCGGFIVGPGPPRFMRVLPKGASTLIPSWEEVYDRSPNPRATRSSGGHGPPSERKDGFYSTSVPRCLLVWWRQHVLFGLKRASSLRAPEPLGAQTLHGVYETISPQSGTRAQRPRAKSGSTGMSNTMPGLRAPYDPHHQDRPVTDHVHHPWSQVLYPFTFGLDTLTASARDIPPFSFALHTHGGVPFRVGRMSTPLALSPPVFSSKLYPVHDL